jgi:hypothetical protein
MLAFSKLVAQAYGLLQWFETEDAVQLTRTTLDAPSQETSLELRRVLKKILEENSRPSDPDKGGNPPPDDRAEGASQEPLPAVAYEKIPIQERPRNRIVSAVDSDARVSKKNNKLKIQGYKIQNLCTTGGVILDTRVIPANEHDREAMADMVQETVDFFRIVPGIVLGDSHYGHGKQRVALAALEVNVVAPVTKTPNPTGLYDISNFTYTREQDTYHCPEGKRTIRKARNHVENGVQHFFDPKDCANCPVKAACTTGKNRSLFHSDFYDIYKAASTFNETVEGKELHLRRYVVERKNKELKRDCGLGTPRTRGSRSLEILSKLASIVVNLKLMVRRLISPNPGFLRRGRYAAV